MISSLLNLPLLREQLSGNSTILSLEKVIIPFKCYWEDARHPVKVYPNSAGHDLYANEFTTLKPSGTALVRVDLQMVIPKSCFMDSKLNYENFCLECQKVF